MFITSFLKINIVRFFESIRCCYAFVYVSIEVINFINKSGKAHGSGIFGHLIGKLQVYSQQVLLLVQQVSRFYQARMLSVLIHSVQQQRFVLRIVL